MCATHVPRANLLYSPRNKILATSLLTEAFLYEEQTRRGVSIRHFDEYGDVADHCTVCHKCESPARWTSTSATSRSRCATCCAELRKRRLNPGTGRRCSSSTPPTRARSSWRARVMIDLGFRAQRFANKLAQAAS